ncbi:universal stress protein [Halobaculum sp. D14]|uniref:universal stress protein n=1 Tax=unclassified Halobaculum TaxID=2640896 RepID=UPI003EB97083
MTALLDTVVVPVAESDDATATAAALSAHADAVGHVTVVHVVEKAGGAPDKAGVEQRETAAEHAFDAFRQGLPDVPTETETVYATDVVDGILDVARDVDASAVVFTPRGGGRLVRLLTGDVTLRLVTDADRPVVSLPNPGGGE